MSNMIPLVIMVCAGAAVALQPSINARLAQKVQSFFGKCLHFIRRWNLGPCHCTADFRKKQREGVTGRGLVGMDGRGSRCLLAVLATILAVPRIGTAATMAVAISAQLLTALILDHFGFFGFGGMQIDLKRSLGAWPYAHDRCLAHRPALTNLTGRDAGQILFLPPSSGGGFDHLLANAADSLHSPTDDQDQADCMEEHDRDQHRRNVFDRESAAPDRSGNGPPLLDLSSFASRVVRTQPVKTVMRSPPRGRR
ncbi:MAG: DMT family transporter [Desulfomicrobium escambiense]|nr:DMT family transporter [Desulfomicrobium escambiense]